jgi:DNA-binding response OmpR family regulator
VKLFGKSEKIIRRILIVEDEPLVAFDNEHFLTEAGYKVVATVDTLADAKRKMMEEHVDLVLSDLRLRGEGDGTDVARFAAERQIPVLYVTGFRPSTTQGLAVGCLAKPYTDKMLLSALTTLETHLAGKKVRRLPPGLTLYRQPDGALPN